MRRCAGKPGAPRTPRFTARPLRFPRPRDDTGLRDRGLVRLVHDDAVLHQIRLSIEIVPGLPQVLGDRIELEQVVSNLLMNAFDAMNDCPTHEREVGVLAIRDGDRWVRVAVRDRGTGVSAVDLERIFEPFHTTKRDGLGIGMSISRTITTFHGGRLWAGNNPDRGATFCLTLRVAEKIPTER
jgi:two-component system sensor kinase FixL